MQFGLGLILGGMIGMIITALMVASSRADEEVRKSYE